MRGLRRPFVFAGLWEGWQNPGTQEWLRTCTIITGQPNELVAEIHTRMPVIDLSVANREQKRLSETMKILTLLTLMAAACFVARGDQHAGYASVIAEDGKSLE